VADRLLRKRLPQDAVAGTPPDDILHLIDDVRRYFSGEAVDFRDVRLDLDVGDDFFRQIYSVTRGLAWGETTTYGTIAKELGAGPQAAQEVGRAMATNPVPLIIPCHRVLAAGGKIGGFSAPGGSASKMKMLQLEGVPVSSSVTLPAQQSFGF
jgi:methylated-DNA-[protein]-cysteine S-methyltransferase